MFTENGQLDQIWKVKILFLEFFKDIKSISISWDLKSLFSESQQKAAIQLPLYYVRKEVEPTMLSEQLVCFQS